MPKEAPGVPVKQQVLSDVPHELHKLMLLSFLSNIVQTTESHGNRRWNASAAGWKVPTRRRKGFLRMSIIRIMCRSENLHTP